MALNLTGAVSGINNFRNETLDEIEIRDVLADTELSRGYLANDLRLSRVLKPRDWLLMCLNPLVIRARACIKMIGANVQQTTLIHYVRHRT